MLDMVSGLLEPSEEAFGEPATPSVLSIVGDRGSGKTTTLYRFSELAASISGNIVLPPIEPEVFSSGDNIVALTIARLVRLFDAKDAEILDSALELPLYLGGDQKIRHALDRLLRFSHLFNVDHAPATSIDQQLSDLSKATYSGETFIELWRRTMAFLTNQWPEVKRIIVPVDDPDLRPELMAQLLQQIRLLSQTPNVVVCVCFNASQARDALISSIVRNGGGSEEQARRTCDAQMLKVFPPYLRVELRPLNIAERTNFTPQGGTATLGALLDQVQFDTPVGVYSLRTILQNGPSVPQDLFTFLSCLPEVPRELVNLHRSLDFLLRRQLDSDRRARLAVETLLSSCLNATRRGYLPDRLGERVVATIGDERDDLSRPTLELNLNGLEFYYVASETLTEVLIAPGVTVDLNHIVEFRVRSRDAAGSQSGGGGDAIDRGIAQTLALAREFTRFSNLYDDSVVGGEPIFGGKSTRLFNLVVRGDEADNFFCVPPRWRSHGDNYAFLRSWARNRRLLEELNELETGYLPGAGDAIALIYIGTVVNTHLGRAQFVIDRDLLLRICRGEATGELHDILRDILTAAAAYATEHRTAEATTREGGLLQWIDVFLPHYLHPALVSPPVTDIIMSFRHGMKSEAGSGESERSLIGLLTQRIQKNYGQNWVDGLLTFCESIPSFDQLPQMKYLHQRAQQQKRAAMSVVALEDRVVSAETNLERDAHDQEPVMRDGEIALRVLDDMLTDAKRDLESRE